MEFLAAIITGLVVGIIAKFLMPGRDPGGFIVTILLGVAGAFLAMFLGRQMGWYATDQPAGWLASIGGAIIILALYRLVFRRRLTH